MAMPAYSNLNSDLSSEIKSTENDKFQSLLNTLKGCEEFVLNEAGVIISSNLESVTITGYEEWEIIGRPIGFFYSPEDQAENKPQKDLEKTAKLGKYISSGFRIKKRGAQFWAKMKYFALYNEDHKIIGYKVVLSDTTHRAMYTLNSRIIKDEYLSLFNNSFIGIFKIALKDFSFLMLNEKALQIIGKERDNLNLSELFHNQNEFQSLLDQIRNHKHIENFEFRLNSIRETYCSISCKVFSVAGFVEGILTDITEKRIQLSSSNKLNTELQKLNSELDNFLYHASHDIRAPLATILGLLNLMKTDNSMSNVQEYSQKIGERVVHMDSLLKDLSHVAYNNAQPVKSEIIDVPKIVNDLIKHYRKEYTFIKSSITTYGQQDFKGDAERIGIILNNIISNAFKYYNPKASSHSVDVAVDSTTEKLIISIVDNGRGIDQNYIGDIFKLFFKMDSRGTGSGLGLYVVQMMLDKLNGTINVNSKLGRGTSITVTIPNVLSSER
jgi:PAS domain S-box-containing protein